MSKASPESASQSRSAAVVTLIAIAISLVVAIGMARADMFYTHRLLESRFRASIVPAAGKLAGLTALDKTEWVLGDDKQHLVVLFGLAEDGKTGDMEYWRDVASRSRSMAPSIQFVGFCVERGTCISPSLIPAPITLLMYMDPLQTHALATGARRRRAFIFRGSEALGMVLIPLDRQMLAVQLADLSRLKIKEGGV